MPAGENIKDDLKLEFKYILHSQKNRKKITVVGNLKNIRCSFAYPLFQNGNIVTCKVSFNIALCLLSNGVMLPPLVLTTMDKLAKFSDIPVLKVSSINFTLLSFQYWITSVWQKRNGQNIQSLLVTSTQLPSGVAKLLRRYNTELIIVPDLVKGEVEPLDEVWCNKFRTEITESYLVWAQQCNAFMLPLETFCKMVYSAWIKCRVTANFDKLFLEDEDGALATILEEQLDQQKQWMRKPNCTAEESKLKFEIIEVFQCTLCANLFHIDECGKHTLKEVVTFGSDVLPKYRRLVGIGTETHFTCFVEHDNGTLVCEICAEDFSRECWAAHHILKHLQQKWCRVCFRQLFVCQEHKCLQNESELTVSVIEEEESCSLMRRFLLIPWS